MPQKGVLVAFGVSEKFQGHFTEKQMKIINKFKGIIGNILFPECLCGKVTRSDVTFEMRQYNSYLMHKNRGSRDALRDIVVRKNILPGRKI